MSRGWQPRCQPSGASVKLTQGRGCGLLWPLCGLSTTCPSAIPNPGSAQPAQTRRGQGHRERSALQARMRNATMTCGQGTRPLTRSLGWTPHTGWALTLCGWVGLWGKVTLVGQPEVCCPRSPALRTGQPHLRPTPPSLPARCSPDPVSYSFRGLGMGDAGSPLTAKPKCLQCDP